MAIRKPASRRPSRAEWQRAMQRYKRGDVVARIAESLGLTPSAVSMRAKRLGIEYGGPKSPTSWTRVDMQRGEKIGVPYAPAAPGGPPPQRRQPIPKREERKAKVTHMAAPAKPAAHAAFYEPTLQEIARLHTLGRSRVQIAALLRVSYAMIEDAIELHCGATAKERQA